MNRRNFLERLAGGLAGFIILPGAGRIWKAVRPEVAMMFWDQTYCEARFIDPEYRCVMENFSVSHDLKSETWELELPQMVWIENISDKDLIHA